MLGVVSFKSCNQIVIVSTKNIKNNTVQKLCAVK